MNCYASCTEDGSVWVSIDDKKGHYLKVIMGEIFGRKNFITNLKKQLHTSVERTTLSQAHDHILIYARDSEHQQVCSLNVVLKIVLPFFFRKLSI